jgi:two-component system, response regulator PdtaR
VDKHRPDVVVLAVGLPDGDGVQAVREVMTVAACPVVLVISHTDAPVVARAVDAGVLGFLAKPVRPEELGPTLDVAIHRFRDIDTMRRENETLRRKLASRKLVERAKGILMRRLGLSEPEAFRRIQKTAMDTRRPMADVAQALLLTEEVGHSRPAKP